MGVCCRDGITSLGDLQPAQGLVTTTKKGRKQHGKTPGPAAHDDLVQRVLSAPAPDVVWLTGITEHLTGEGKLYCCSIKDCFSNRIVATRSANA